jgi:hypothetical protein
MGLKMVYSIYVKSILNLAFSIDQLAIGQLRYYSLNQAVNQAEFVTQLGNQPAKWLNRLIDGRTEWDPNQCA